MRAAFYCNSFVTDGPELCGSYSGNFLSPEVYRVTSEVCGNPQPTMKCAFNGKMYKNDSVKKIEDKYGLSVAIPTHLQYCERKKLICTIEGHGNPIIKSETLYRNCKIIPHFFN